MVLRIALVLVVVLALGATATVGLAAGNPAGTASASSISVLVKRPDGSVSAAGPSASAPPNGRSTSAYTFPGDGSVVSVGSATAQADTGPGADPRGAATTELHGVSLFGGEITIEKILVSADAVARSGTADGTLSSSGVDGFAVGGAPMPVASTNSNVSLGYGYLVLLEQAVQRDDADRPAYRGFVTGIHVYLTADHGGLPAGSEIIVGYAEAAAAGAAKAASEEPPPPPAQTDGESGSTGNGSGDTRPPKDHSAKPPPGTDEGPPAIVRNPPASVRPSITGQGHAFPVYGPATFSDDFAAPRGDTIWHHGNDIYSSLGAPVLAVAEGTVYSVGWNDLGGQRLWLRDDQGNEYYYAHLSAYSPLAVDGARVSAGDVLGFVGNTGDAQGGAYHLHFEIHPRALLGLGYDGVINPFTYLTAWYQQRDEEFSVTLPASAGGAAPEPGAVLLGGKDISTASGLDPESVGRVMGLPQVLDEGVSFLPPIRPRLVGAPAGFTP